MKIYSGSHYLYNFDNTANNFSSNNLEKELITPPTNGLILNGVVRQSVLELCNDWNKFAVFERSITMTEFQSLHASHRVLKDS